MKKSAVVACVDEYEKLVEATSGYPALARKLTDECILKLGKCPPQHAAHFIEEWLRGYLGYVDELMVLMTGDLLRGYHRKRHEGYIQDRGHEATYVKGQQQHPLTACSKDGLDYAIRALSGSISTKVENRLDACSDQVDQRLQKMDGNVARLCQALRDMGALEVKCDISRNKFKSEALTVVFPPQLGVARLHMTRGLLYTKFPRDLVSKAEALRQAISDPPGWDAAKVAALEAEAARTKEMLLQSKREAAATVQPEMSLDKIKAQVGAFSLLSTAYASVVHMEDDEALEADRVAAAATAGAGAAARQPPLQLPSVGIAGGDGMDVDHHANSHGTAAPAGAATASACVKSSAPFRDRGELAGLPTPQTRIVRVSVLLPKLDLVTLTVELTYNAALVLGEEEGFDEDDDDGEEGNAGEEVGGGRAAGAGEGEEKRAPEKRAKDKGKKEKESAGPPLAVHEGDLLEEVYWRLWGGSAQTGPCLVLPVSISLREPAGASPPSEHALGTVLIPAGTEMLWLRCIEHPALPEALKRLWDWAQQTESEATPLPPRDRIPPLPLVRRLAAWLAHDTPSAGPRVLDLSRMGVLLLDRIEVVASILQICRLALSADSSAALRVSVDHSAVDGELLFLLLTRCTHVSCACCGLGPRAVCAFLEMRQEAGEKDLQAPLVVLDAPHNAFVSQRGHEGDDEEGERAQEYEEEEEGGDEKEAEMNVFGRDYPSAWAAFCCFLLVCCPDLERLNLAHGASTCPADLMVLVRGIVGGMEGRYRQGLPALAELDFAGLESLSPKLAEYLRLQSERLAADGRQTTVNVKGMVRVIPL